MVIGEVFMRPEKTSIAKEIKSRIDGKGFVILTDYRGLDVPRSNELRNRLRAVDSEFSVVKNRLMRHVTEDAGYGMLNEGLRGPTALVAGDGDVVEAAKVLKAFIRETDKPVIKMGAMEGVRLSAADIEHLAGLPPKPILQGQLVGTLAAPMTQLAGVLHQKLCTLLYVLKAVEEKKTA